MVNMVGETTVAILNLRSTTVNAKVRLFKISDTGCPVKPGTLPVTCPPQKRFSYKARAFRNKLN